MGRLPEIGDHVWRVEEGKTTFDGYVAHESNAGTTLVVPRDAPLEVQHNGILRVAGAVEVDALLLVRHLHGWRWVSHEFRPELRVGDIIEGPVSVIGDEYLKKDGDDTLGYFWHLLDSWAPGRPTEHRPAGPLVIANARFLCMSLDASQPLSNRWRPLNDAAQRLFAMRSTIGLPDWYIWPQGTKLQIDTIAALAGLDGWKWIPAGWPGEPK